MIFIDLKSTSAAAERLHYKVLHISSIWAEITEQLTAVFHASKEFCNCFKCK